jgi:DNA mismatch repair protein MutS
VPTMKPSVRFDRNRSPATVGNFRPEKSRRSMSFHSILYQMPEDRGKPLGEPVFFTDLNCDQIVAAIIADKAEYNLASYFYDCLGRLEAIAYRHEIMHDLQNRALYDQVERFAASMRQMREQLQLVTKLRYKEQKQAWHLEAAAGYCAAVRLFANALGGIALKSRGFIGFRDYLIDFVRSGAFSALEAEAQRIRDDLAGVEYCVLSRWSSFTVRRYQGEPDYSAEVEQTFEKFKQGAVKDYRLNFRSSADMNHIEAKILEFVVKLHPDVFRMLDEYCGRYIEFTNPTIMTFDREVQFYVAYLQYIALLRNAQLPFCYPDLSERPTEVFATACFDLALAQKLVAQKSPVVLNDFFLRGQERIIVVSGPNQGGKTTFARSVGQMHYLASIGCPVPGREARLQLFDRLFTHFEKEEKVENLRGKLEDDLVRIREILSKATFRSIIILNEVFTSTTIQDETFLSNKVMTRIVQLKVLCVWVTFVDELASFGPETVSMVSTVVPENPATRTFKVVRQAADGLAYALAIAQKYDLTYEAICKRIGQ